MLRLLSRAFIPTLASALILLTGCGTSGSIVTGELLFGAAKMGDGDKIVVLLEADGKNYSAEADATGKFTITNVLPGTYKVKVTQYLAASTPSEGKGSPVPGGNAPAPGKGSPVSKGPPPGIQGGGSPEGPSMAGPNAPKIYPEEWTVPGGPFKLDMSKLKK